MAKMTIEVSEFAHGKLMELQLKRKLSKNKRIALAEIASDVIEDFFKEEKPSK